MHSPGQTGVLTFHRCINYGSYWQARCLVEGLQARGLDAILLDHNSPHKNFVEWKCALQPTLPTPVPAEDHARYKEKLHAFLCAFESLPLSPKFPLDNPGEMPEYDTIVVGSDEVWNLCHPWYGGYPLFFGAGNAKRWISYAASFGHYDASAGLPAHWIDALHRFKAISIRDENSRQLIAGALGIEPALVLDPCLQFEVRPEGSWHGPDGSFVAVYGHNFSSWFARAVRQWADERGKTLVSIGYRNDWADVQWLEAGPHDFAHGMARAESVVTNFFHGCVFALRGGKPFVCETSPYRRHKVRDLMELTGAEAHLAGEDTPASVYDALLHEPVAPAISTRITALRAFSNSYLDGALA